MPWTRLDDRFHTNPKILGLTHQAFRLYVVALNWSVSELTDGRIPVFVPPMILPLERERVRSSAVAELVDRALWKPDTEGWEIHDFAHYQETSTKVQERRSRWAVEKRGQRQVSATDKPPDKVSDSKPDPVRKRDARPGGPIPKPKETSLRSVSPDDEHAVNRNGIWTALEDLFGVPAATDQSLRGKVVKSLVAVGATYTEVKRRAAVWPKLFSKDGKPLTLTPTALESHWGQLGKLLEVEESKALPPCQICDSRRIVGISKDGEVVKVDDPRAVANERCVCVEAK